MPKSFINDAAFIELSRYVLRDEGEWADEEQDDGGATKYGIAWNYNKSRLRAMGINSEEELKQLTKEQALQMYYELYWLPSGADKIVHLSLAYVHFDAAINHGVGKANEFMKTLRKKHQHYDFSDGKNNWLGLYLALEYCTRRVSYYAQLPDAPTFLEGWMNRMVRVQFRILNQYPL